MVAVAEKTNTVDVLVVDDDPNSRLLVEDLLAADDRNLHFAQSGGEALRLLRRVTPAVILLDVELGDMSGFEVATLCRSNERLSSVPIVFITGHAFDDDSMAAGYDLGAIDYLSKPIVPPILMSKVAALCTLAHQMKLISDQRDQLETARRELQEANRELERLAATDPLTGLANRRHFITSLAAQRARQERSGGALAVAMLDLDGFKAVNDLHGHALGDEILVRTSRRLRAAVRPYDIVARLGGDEFAIVLDQFEDPQDIRGVADRLRRELEEPHRLPDDCVIEAPASIGIVDVLPGSIAGVDEILAEADRAMYRSKADPERSVVLAVRS